MRQRVRFEDISGESTRRLDNHCGTFEAVCLRAASPCSAAHFGRGRCMTVRPGGNPRTSLSRRSRRLMGIALTLPAILLAALLVLPGTATAGDPSPPPSPEFESASDPFLPPGGSITTLNGPLNADDPFAVALKNIGDKTLDVTIAEEPCDGNQEGDPLCSVPRVGGVAGNFMFQPSGGGGALRASTSTAAVVVARLYYDVSVLVGVKGFRIFYQKPPDDSVVRLPRCDDGITTECFRKDIKANGDQIVRVRLSFDPRITRG